MNELINELKIFKLYFFLLLSNSGPLICLFNYFSKVIRLHQPIPKQPYDMWKEQDN